YFTNMFQIQNKLTGKHIYKTPYVNKLIYRQCYLILTNYTDKKIIQKNVYCTHQL
ncbi:hypothetical protein EHRUM4_06920, partial [Ehrlichia ruminantium]